MKRLFASFDGSTVAGLSRLVDISLLGVLVLALLQLAQTVWAPQTARVSLQDATSGLNLAKTESTAATLSDVFFRDVSPSARKAAPLVDKGNIKLFGTRPGNNGMGSAILSDNGQPQAVFKTGQALNKGAVLTAVYGDRVEISRNGDVRAIYLHDRATQEKRQLIKSTTQQTAAQPQANAAPSRAAPQRVQQTKARSLFPSQRKRARPGARQQRASANILSALNLSASGSNLKIGSDADADVLDGLGLSQGDVITAINGQSVSSKSAMANMYRQLQRGGGMAVTLLRDGQKMTVSINANALKLAQTGR